jgi:geranylgeranyl diphosphate synthase type II
LVRGQVQDLAAEHHDVSAQALMEIHDKKTGALFVAAVTIPALLVGDEEAVAALGQFARHFGLAFQMVDDILNVIGDAQRLGKATGTDAGLGKATYPRLLGLDGARTLLLEHAAIADKGLDPARGSILRGLLGFAVDRTW